MRKLFFLMTFLVSIVVILAACGADSTTGEDGEQENGGKGSAEDMSVIVGITASVETLDPANHRDRTTESVIRNIFDGLVRAGEDGEIEPLIAESWDNPTPTEWVFEIKQGVKFHDGSDLTVDDVVFTFERIINEGAMGGETSPRQGLLGTLEKVEAIDETSVRFTFESPWPIFLKMLPHQQIIPKAYVEEDGDEEFRNHPIGAGPFKFVEASLDDRIVLEKFADYYDGAPEIDFLVFDVIPETSSRVSALQTGEVHRIHALSPTLAEELKADDSVEVKDVNSTRVYMAEMNTQMEPFRSEEHT